MVLGFILYETIDLVYNVGLMTYNGSSYLYKWYYGIENEEIKERIRRIKIKIGYIGKKITYKWDLQ